MTVTALTAATDARIIPLPFQIVGRWRLKFSGKPQLHGRRGESRVRWHCRRGSSHVGYPADAETQARYAPTARKCTTCLNTTDKGRENHFLANNVHSLSNSSRPLAPPGRLKKNGRLARLKETTAEHKTEDYFCTPRGVQQYPYQNMVPCARECLPVIVVLRDHFLSERRPRCVVAWILQLAA